MEKTIKQAACICNTALLFPDDVPDDVPASLSDVLLSELLLFDTTLPSRLNQDNFMIVMTTKTLIHCHIIWHMRRLR